MNANIKSFIIQFHDENFDSLLNKVVDVKEEVEVEVEVKEEVEVNATAFEFSMADTANSIVNPHASTVGFNAIKFNPEPYKFELFNLCENAENKYKFGIIELEMADCPIIDKLKVDFMLDMSGSMDENQKMACVIHSMKNIMILFAKYQKESGAEIRVIVNGFDNSIERIIPETIVTDDNFTELNLELKKRLVPRGGTNFEIALNELNRLDDFASASASAKTNHHAIIMTDGEVNEGIVQHDMLVSLVNKSIPCSFIGYGKGHNSRLLQKMADYETGLYKFVPNNEAAPLVFAEIIHAMLYPAMTKVVIKVEGAEIYNYQTNEWSNELYIPCIVSEVKKTWHIRTLTDPTLVTVSIDCAESKEIPSVSANMASELKNLNYYKHRQFCQELLYFAKNDRRKHGLRNDLKRYFKYLKQFIIDNKLDEDVGYKTLCDDLYIVYSTFHLVHAEMYIASRQQSQGTQCSYQVSEEVEEEEIQPFNANHNFGGGLVRQVAIDFDNEVVDYNDGMDMGQNINEDIGQGIGPHKLSRGVSNHTTPKQLSLMRSVSSN